jgi:hypothetical protein
MSDFPEHEKLQNKSSNCELLSRFVKWLDDNKYYICQKDSDFFFMTYKPYINLVSEFLGIDLNKIEDEKELMIKLIKEQEQQNGD